MRKIKLTRQEKEIEKALLNEEYIDVSQEEFNELVKSIAARKKDAVLNVRINSNDLKNIKQKAKKMGIRYQTLISEFLHRLALKPYSTK